MKISDVVELREEVLKGEIHGWDDLVGIFKRGKESDPEYIFNTTYPTTEIRNLIAAINDKIKGAKRTGLFEIMGGYGTGKSRILCLIYHLFKNFDRAKVWLESNGLSLETPKKVNIIALKLNYKPPNYLWEPIFKELGKENLLVEVTSFPGIELFERALAADEYTLIILDEIESWYTGVKDRANNLNFIQVLAEVACDKKSKLLVFCALYGENKEILVRLGRVKPYRVNLTLSKDRPKVILHRLVEKVDKDNASKIVDEYVKHYRNSEVSIEDLPTYRKAMISFYPIHPELMNTLLTRYSSSPYYQNTRGILFLLGTVLRKKMNEVDMLLSSDIDMTEPDLIELDRVLAENAQKDAEGLGSLERNLLNTILLYSFGERAGATSNDVVLGVLRPGININDVLVALTNLPNVAPHVWPRNGKYVIRREENIATLIQKRSVEKIEKGDIKDALDLIKLKLKRDKSYFVYHPNEEFSDNIEDTDRLTIVVSLKTLNQSEINELYRGRTFGNMLVLYVPKNGDLTMDKDLMVIAERLRLASQFQKEVSGDNKALLERQRERDEKHLRERLREAYGRWVKVIGFKDGNIDYRLVQCDIQEIRSTIIRHHTAEVFRDQILKHLEDKQMGLKIEDLKYDFKITPGKPIIITEKPLEEAVRSLYDRGEIVVVYKGKSLRKPDPLPPLRDGMKLVLSKFAPPVEEVVKPEEAKEAPKEISKERERLEELTKLEIKEKKMEEAVKPLLETLKTSTYSTPFLLSQEIERKVPEEATIKSIEISIQGASFPDFDSFLKFASSLKIGKLEYSDVSLKLVVNMPLSKKALVQLIDKLPPKMGGGNIGAKIEVEKVA